MRGSSRTALGLAPLILFLAACGDGERAGDAASGKVPITVWFHSGQAAERATFEKQVARFNRSQDRIVVEPTMLPEGTYNTQVQAAALSDDLPDLLEFDGPYLYNYIWQGRLRRLDDLVPETVRRDLLPSIVAQGTYHGRLYSIGVFDSGLGLFARRSRLQAAGVRIPVDAGGAPTPGRGWTAEEFDAVLEALANKDEDGAVLDLKLNLEGEWITYAFSPILASAGGDLIDRETYQTASGVLNSAASIRALSRVQRWIQKGYVDPNVDDAAFVTGRVALSWAGHWEYRRYFMRVGEDLVVLPLPDFGHGSKSGQGSWNWAVTERCPHPEAAMQFLTFLLEPDEVLAMANANGAVPATRTAVARSKIYGEGGPLRLFAQQLEQGHTVPRPRTPAYPMITSVFQQAFRDIRAGADVKAVLDRAAKEIDRDIRENRGYRRE
jgi:multiple sugar transport system substrate-binding protein